MVSVLQRNKYHQKIFIPAAICLVGLRVSLLSFNTECELLFSLRCRRKHIKNILLKLNEGSMHPTEMSLEKGGIRERHEQLQGN